MRYEIRPTTDPDGCRTVHSVFHSDDPTPGFGWSWLADAHTEKDAKTIVAALELVARLANFTDPGISCANGDTDEEIEAFRAVILLARAALGQPAEFDHAPVTCERCGFFVDGGETDESCDCPPDPCSICERTEGHDKECANAPSITDADNPSCYACDAEDVCICDDCQNPVCYDHESTLTRDKGVDTLCKPCDEKTHGDPDPEPHGPADSAREQQESVGFKR